MKNAVFVEKQKEEWLRHFREDPMVKRHNAEFSSLTNSEAPH